MNATETVQTMATTQPAGLPEAVSRRGIDEPQWRTLMHSLFPGAKAESVLMVVDYCRARKLDPLKKPCHIVPMKVKNQQTGNWDWRDVVMPGIYEYRTAAMRTGLYLGHSAPEYGPESEQFGVQAPAWCAMTIYRAGRNGERIEFPVRVLFREAVGLKDGKANDRWGKAPFQMITKVCEASGLREAFPDEFGGEATADEVDGQQQMDVTPVPPIKAAQRISQATPVVSEPVAVVATETEPVTPAGAPAHIGQITNVQDKGNGGAMVVLSTGFQASTRDSEIIKAAATLRDTQALVELVTTASSDPEKYAPKLAEMIVVESGEIAS